MPRDLSISERPQAGASPSLPPASCEEAAIHQGHRTGNPVRQKRTPDGVVLGIVAKVRNLGSIAMPLPWCVHKSMFPLKIFDIDNERACVHAGVLTFNQSRAIGSDGCFVLPVQLA